ncbi:DDE-type integrase/transposase/recombinase, partial [Mobiluncus mulieris]|nr:DDE-type integrase/transposase/recombinase [Mobiluncus mulieris]
GFVYTAFVTDVYSRQIVGWATRSTMTPEALPLEALEQAIGCAKDNLTGLIHHTDHGCQYVSIKYSQRLTDAGIRSSTGTIGDSYDNALAETVNGLYKTELIYSQTWLMYRSRMGDPELGVLVKSPASPRIARLFHSRGSNNPIQSNPC